MITASLIFYWGIHVDFTTMHLRDIYDPTMDGSLITYTHFFYKKLDYYIPVMTYKVSSLFGNF